MRPPVSKSLHRVEVVNCALREDRDSSDAGFLVEYSDGKVFRFPTSALRFMTVTNALLTERESPWFRRNARQVKTPIQKQTTAATIATREPASLMRRISVFTRGYDPSY